MKSVFLLSFLISSSFLCAQKKKPVVHPSIAFINVTIIDVVKGTMLPGSTVIITGNRISWVGKQLLIF